MYSPKYRTLAIAQLIVYRTTLGTSASHLSCFRLPPFASVSGEWGGTSPGGEAINSFKSLSERDYTIGH